MPTPTILQWGTLTVAGDNSSSYHLDDISGWYGELPPARFDSDPRSNAHGEFDGPVWSSARVVTLTGSCRTNTQRDTLFQALAAAAVFDGDTVAGTLTAQVAGLTLSTAAHVIGKTPTRVPGAWGLGQFGFQVQWRCPDPLLYAPTVSATCGMPSSGGGLVFPLFIVAGVITWGTVPAPQIASVTNNGTADTSVLLTVAAGGTPITGGFQIVETVTGSVLTYVDDLPAGSSVVFDSSTGAVTLNGTADRRGSLTVAQFWQVPKGATRTAVLLGLVGFSSTATLTAAIRPAYW